MFIDARKLPDKVLLEFDVCIIGGGAAGITLARQFLSSSVKVCLLESGGLRFDKTTQSLYEGKTVGLDYELDGTRTRFFGGSTNCWGGFCRPIDDYHFGKRSWVRHSGWPFSKTMLDPFYERALTVCGIEPEEMCQEYWQKNQKQNELNFLPFDKNKLPVNVIKVNRKNRKLGVISRSDIKESDNVKVYLYANATHLNAGQFGGDVDTLSAATLSGKQFAVKSKFFIVASGGIENARILLNSNSVKKNGIGNEYDLVGRFFMEHAAFPIGTLKNCNDLHKYLVHDTSFAFRRLPIGAEIRIPFEVQEQKEILDSVTFLNAVVGGEESRGADATKNAYTRLRRGDYSSETWKDLFVAATDPINAVRFCGNALLPSPRSFRYGILTTVVEPTPNPDSRIVLGTEKDQLGVNRVCLTWRPGSMESRTVAEVRRVFETELPRCGIGTFEPWTDADDAKPPHSHRWCWHHMGTTRMHDDPKQGVVDRNCRVHGVGNLYVAGSSVFPTGGYNTPTLTIIALALRLADHMKTQLENETAPTVDCARVA
jgi:choline dehydrogenase-like flavoprotein